jgi:RNA polymerase sigma factor (sigma-70 family)
VVESSRSQFKKESNSQSKNTGELMQSNEDYSATVDKYRTLNKMFNKNKKASSSNKDAREKRAEVLNRILNSQEKEIISLRFGIPDDNNMTLEQVGKNLGLTRERVRQIEQKALKKLREHPSLKFLKDYLDE